MSKITIKGSIGHLPNAPWKPCAGATVQIIDVDQGGNGDDVIFTATTDSNGFFSGISNDWEDKNNVKVTIPGPFGTSMSIDQDVPDVLLLKIRVKQGSNTYEGAFVFNPAGISAPVFVPWPAPVVTTPIFIAKVNGEACNTPYDIQAKVRKKAESNANPITIEVYGEPAKTLKDYLNKNTGDLKAWLNTKYPGIQDFLYTNPVAIDDIIIACAIFCVAFGFATVLTIGVNAVLISIAVAVILALYLGYQHIEVQTEADQNGKVTTRLVLTK